LRGGMIGLSVARPCWSFYQYLTSLYISQFSLCRVVGWLEDAQSRCCVVCPRNKLPRTSVRDASTPVARLLAYITDDPPPQFSPKSSCISVALMYPSRHRHYDGAARRKAKNSHQITKRMLPMQTETYQSTCTLSIQLQPSPANHSTLSYFVPLPGR
jgi:hypothetical protein